MQREVAHESTSRQVPEIRSSSLRQAGQIVAAELADGLAGRPVPGQRLDPRLLAQGTGGSEQLLPLGLQTREPGAERRPDIGDHALGDPGVSADRIDHLTVPPGRRSTAMPSSVSLSVTASMIAAGTPE